MAEKKVNLETAKKLGISPEELEMIRKLLGRMPNFTELSIYSVMWSEHASYKNSIKWLKTSESVFEINLCPSFSKISFKAL